MEKLSPLSDPLLYGSIVKTPEGKNLYMVVPMSIIARLTIFSFYKFERLKSHIKAISQDKQQYPVLRESVLAARLQF